MGIDHDTVLYMKEPLDRDELNNLADMLEDPIEDLVRNDAFLKKLEIDHDSLAGDRDAVIDLLVEHKRLLQRPIVVKGKKAVIGRPTDAVRELLS